MFRWVKQNKIGFAEDCRQRGKWSEPHFLTSKLLLSESMVNVIIRKIFVRHSLSPPTRTAKPVACEGSRVRTKSAQSFSTF